MGSAERCPLQAAGEVTEGCSPLGDLTCLGRPLAIHMASRSLSFHTHKIKIVAFNPHYSLRA